MFITLINQAMWHAVQLSNQPELLQSSVNFKSLSCDRAHPKKSSVSTQRRNYHGNFMYMYHYFCVYNNNYESIMPVKVFLV